MTVKKPADELVDVEKFVLTRDELLSLFNKVSQFWRRKDFSTMQNLEYEALMGTTKVAIKHTNMKVLETIWFGLNFFIDEIRTLNGLKLSLLEATTEKDIAAKRILYQMETHRIESGEIFIDN